jgi:sulfatase modifying factor 1
MLDARMKWAIFLGVVFLTTLPVMGIINTPKPVVKDPTLPAAQTEPAERDAAPVDEAMVEIPAGPFIRGTKAGGYNEQPERVIELDAYKIDRFEVTNHQYRAFVAATGHRKAAPPSRYAKNVSKMSGVNQPVTYVSWEDADAYCHWKGKRLPTEAEWEKAMRGTDGRLLPWGQELDLLAANLGSANDGFEATAPVASFARDRSPFGVYDGIGNVMEWVADWYGEDAYRDADGKNPRGPDHGVYKVLRGAGYTSTGNDIRITNRTRMVPDFRDETIGFRCASSVSGGRKNGKA